MHKKYMRLVLFLLIAPLVSAGFGGGFSGAGGGVSATDQAKLDAMAESGGAITFLGDVAVDAGQTFSVGAGLIVTDGAMTFADDYWMLMESGTKGLAWNNTGNGYLNLVSPGAQSTTQYLMDFSSGTARVNALQAQTSIRCWTDGGCTFGAAGFAPSNTYLADSGAVNWPSGASLGDDGSDNLVLTMADVASSEFKINEGLADGDTTRIRFRGGTTHYLQGPTGTLEAQFGSDGFRLQAGDFRADPAVDVYFESIQAWTADRPDFPAGYSVGSSLVVTDGAMTMADGYWLTAEDGSGFAMDTAQDQWDSIGPGGASLDFLDFSSGALSAQVGTLTLDSIAVNAISGPLRYSGPLTYTIATGVINQGWDPYAVVAAESGTADTLDQMATPNYTGQQACITPDAGDTITVTHTASPSTSGQIYSLSGTSHVLPPGSVLCAIASNTETVDYWTVP